VKKFPANPFDIFIQRSAGGWLCGKGSIPAFVLLLLWILLLVGGSKPAESSSLDPPNWTRIGHLKPSLKVLVFIGGENPISLEDLVLFADRGFWPADRDPALILGRKKAIFKISLRQWLSAPSLPPGFHAQILERFQLRGIYRVGFKVEEKDYTGPLTLEVTAPRDGFGRILISHDSVVRPCGSVSHRVDSAGNRWTQVNYPEIRTGQTIHFSFSFYYQVNMSDVLARDLLLAEAPLPEDLPPDILPFLRPGYKIDPTLPAALAWAQKGNPGPPDARQEYERLSRFLKESITYDKRKRQEYFGGQAVCSDLDSMYQDVPLTLESKKGCCPDTVLLECSFLRARGIPCRTAGRFGHFFSLVYLPGRGWMSTSVTPLEVPLIVAPGPDHLPYQKWSPRIALRTTQWETQFQIEPREGLECP
jgi:hypothetical protein